MARLATIASRKREANVAATVPTGDNQIEELRRRVQEDPAPFAIAQLADAYRRERLFAEAIECLSAGLHRHPYYLSLRVILGRTLAEHGETEEAAAEFQRVLAVAPDNLMALRGLAEIKERQAAAPVDFDEVLGALGMPDREAPPSIERLIADAPVAPSAHPAGAPSTTPGTSGEGETAAQAPADDLLAVLERRLRSYDGAGVNQAETPAPEAAVADEPTAVILGELEAWLAALGDRRAGQP
jgi:tetratricopeptide (TPR) repeat protein